MRPQAPYHFFWSGPFSQWHPSLIKLDGVIFDFAEQAMMHQKALLFEDTQAAERILSAPEPSEQKAIGQQVRAFDQATWDARKINIVLRISRAKYQQNDGLRRKLFQTGRALLAEASPHDLIWGIGMDAKTAAVTDPDYWPGQNLLGRILTQVRDEMAAMYPDQAMAAAPEVNWYDP